MFTIKHIEPNGAEHLYEADSVDRTPDGQLVFTSIRKLVSGKAYVMNEAGKTIADYDFNKKQ